MPKVLRYDLNAVVESRNRDMAELKFILKFLKKNGRISSIILNTDVRQMGIRLIDDNKLELRSDDYYYPVGDCIIEIEIILL